MIENNRVITSRQLAAALKISVRSVKTYIQQINDVANANVIIANKDGYQVNSALANAYIRKREHDTPQNFTERSNYIIRQLIIENTSKLNINDLAEELYTSDSTLKADIHKMNILYAKYGISFKLEKDELFVIGSERALRKMFSKAIYNDVGNNYVDLNMVKDVFTRFDVRYIMPTLKAVLSNNNYYVNDVALVNMILHIAIIIDRLMDHKSLSRSMDIPMKSEMDKKVVEELCNGLEQEFNVQFDEPEKDEIYILVRANANLAIPDSLNDLTNYVGKDIMNMTDQLIRTATDKYGIDLSNSSFVIPFALHLKNLVYRYKTGKIINNPMIDSIMMGHPIVYDIAVFMGMQLIDKYDIEANESELGFIALHVGGELERQRMNYDKISTVLLCPNYMNLSTKLYNSLLMDFNNDINIIATVTSLSQVSGLKFSLLITTVTGIARSDFETIVITPFSSQLNKVEIQSVIEKCKNKLKSQTLRKHFEDYFEKDLFFTNQQGLNSAEQIIRFMSKRLNEKGYTPDDYADKVLLRENAATTAFYGFAIPHSMESSSYKTSVAVLISQEQMTWNSTQNVNIVFLIALGQRDSYEFSRLYEGLVVLLSETRNIELLKKCKTFDEFQNLMFSLLN